MAGDVGFGSLLRRLRRHAGLSQEELAARAFVSTRAISDLERGVNALPRRHTTVALADGLGLVGDARAAFERAARPDIDDRSGEHRDVDARGPGDHGLAPPAGLVVPDSARAPLPVDVFVDLVDEPAQLVGGEDRTTLDTALALLRDPNHRIVTLLGPGGVGKTRHAIELAQRVDPPVAFVALASLRDPELLAVTLVDALGADHGPRRTPIDSLAAHIGDHRLVLVLDNLEQVVAAASDVAALVRRCPHLTVVATSRVPLQVAGEVRCTIAPLPTAADDLGAAAGVRLYVERARAVGHHVRDDEVASVAELCRRLDGLPLAIELAAARARVVPPGDVLLHLDRVLDLLHTHRADAPEQHRSLRAALEWSYRLLTPPAQEAFAALGLFPAGASAEAAMTVWGLAPGSSPAFFDLVQTLDDAHLVRVEHEQAEPGAAPTLRLSMLETTRQFALAELAASEGASVAAERMARWAVQLVERAEPALGGSDQAHWLAVIDRELPNLRAVAGNLTPRPADDTVDVALRIGAGLQRYWDIRARWHEGLAWLSDALASGAGAPAARAKAHKARGVMHRCLGQLETARQESITAVELFLAAGEEAGVASCLNNQGVVSLDRAEFAEAIEVFERALARCEAAGDDGLRALVLNNLAVATLEQGRVLDAFRLARTSAALMERLGNVSALNYVEDNLALALTRAGHPRWAVPIHRRTIRHRAALRDDNGLAYSIEVLAEAWIALGETDLAGRALGVAAEQRRRLGSLPIPLLTALTERRTAALVDRVGEARASQWWDEGIGLAPSDVLGWCEA